MYKKYTYSGFFFFGHTNPQTPTHGFNIQLIIEIPLSYIYIAMATYNIILHSHFPGI